MCDVDIRVDRNRDLTQVILTGILAPEDFNRAMRDQRFGHTGCVLWDLRNASFSDMNRDKLQIIAHGVKELEDLTGWIARGTAVVANNQDGLLMIRLYFEIARFVVGRRTVAMGTTSIDEALAWLSGLQDCTSSCDADPVQPSPGLAG